MNRNKMYLLALMILPWFSLPLLGKNSLKRFFPGALFIFLFVAIESAVANKRSWWRVFERINPKVMGEIPFMGGPFFVGSLWILKLTYGKFLRYFSLNFFLDVLFTYPGVWVLKRLGIASLIRLKHYQFLLIFLAKAILMYGFQGLFNKSNKKRFKWF